VSATPQSVRRGFYFASDVDAILQRWTTRKHISLTEGAQRAIKAWDFIQTARANGAQIALIENGPGGRKIREVVWLD
jgi:hypothetical protein